MSLEPNLFAAVAAGMQAMGHPVNTTNGSVGGFQAIFLQRDPFLPGPVHPPGRGHAGNAPFFQTPLNGVYRSGSDHRKDGHAVGW